MPKTCSTSSRLMLAFFCEVLNNILCFFPLYSKKLPNISGEEIKKPYRLEEIIRIKEDNPLDLADFVSKATIKVPETTFNNMHGRLEDVSTEDGKIFAAKAGTMGKYFFQRLFCDITDFKKENLF